MGNRYIGDRSFYRHVLGIAVPIIVQNGITNFVSLLDNIMVGQVGTIPMSGVSIVNGLIFVFNLCILSAAAGAGIFTAQFHGSQDTEGVCYTFRFKFLCCTLLGILGSFLLFLSGPTLIGLYLTGDGDAAMAAGALDYGMRYLTIMLWGFLPFALTNIYSSTLKECGNTFLPMVGSIAAVLVNLILNYVLIFGHFGAPALGVEGAAWATVISRYAEMLIVCGWVHLNPGKNPYILGAYRSMYLPGKLLKSIIIKGMPLLVNDALWAGGMAVMNQCYSTCGLDVVPAMNISSTLLNLASVVSLSLGYAVGIIMGQMLGAERTEAEVRDSNRKLQALSVGSGVLFGALMAAFSTLFPRIYNTTDSVRHLATWLICIEAVYMPFDSYVNATYFTLRSGGQTLVTFLFDSCFTWGCCVPLAYCLSRFTSLSILPLFTICIFVNLLKCAIGARMLRQGKWIQNLTV